MSNTIPVDFYPDFSEIFDEQILKILNGTSYSPTDALIAQLILEIRRLNSEIAKLK